MTAIGDIYEMSVVSRETTQSVLMVNVFHFRQKAGFLSAINLIGEWQTAMNTLWRSMIASGVIIEKFSARSLIPLNADGYETTASLGGLRSTTPLPPLVAAVVTWRTGFPGRRNRGRSYFGGVPINDHTGGRLSSAYLTGPMAAYCNQVMSVFGAGGSSPTTEIGVWSRLNAGPDPPYDPAGFRVITSYTAQPMLGSMGTRRTGRGF